MPLNPEPSRPTMRQIAARVGVSTTTVSLALRASAKISEATRRRIQTIATELGYRPDPAVAKLMHHLQSRHKPSFQANLCALTTQSKNRPLAYATAMREGAERRAESLGYRLTVLHIEEATRKRADLQRVLTSRGVEGLLLLPMQAPGDFTEMLDWRDFSVVSATYGVLAPQFHRVVPHQFTNTMLLCERLRKMGYRRIGLVLHAEHDVRVHHNFSAAVSWQNLLGGAELVRPLIYSDAEAKGLQEWFRAERPDVIVAAGEADGRWIIRRLGLSVPGPVGFAIMGAEANSGSGFAGIEERPAEIGARAVDLLASMVQREEKGVPEIPSVTMIEGRWIDGLSIQSLPR